MLVRLRSAQSILDLLHQGHRDLHIAPGAGLVRGSCDPTRRAGAIGELFPGHFAEDDHLGNVAVDHLRVLHRIYLEHTVLTVVEEDVQNQCIACRIPEVPVINADLHKLLG